jgi:hypothetical protein
MICKWDMSKTYVMSCPTVTTLPGTALPNTSYEIVIVTAPVTGNGAYTSYLSQCDADNFAYNLAFSDASNQRKANPCKYRVTATYTGTCPASSVTPIVVGTGVVEGTGIYDAYLQAVAIASGIVMSRGCRFEATYVVNNCDILYTGHGVSYISQSDAELLAELAATKKGDQGIKDNSCLADAWCSSKIYGIYGIYG